MIAHVRRPSLSVNGDGIYDELSDWIDPWSYPTWQREIMFADYSLHLQFKMLNDIDVPDIIILLYLLIIDLVMVI